MSSGAPSPMLPQSHTATFGLLLFIVIAVTIVVGVHALVAAARRRRREMRRLQARVDNLENRFTAQGA